MVNCALSPLGTRRLILSWPSSFYSLSGLLESQSPICTRRVAPLCHRFVLRTCERHTEETGAGRGGGDFAARVSGRVRAQDALADFLSKSVDEILAPQKVEPPTGPTDGSEIGTTLAEGACDLQYCPVYFLFISCIFTFLTSKMGMLFGYFIISNYIFNLGRFRNLCCIVRQRGWGSLQFRREGAEGFPVSYLEWKFGRTGIPFLNKQGL